MVCYYYSREVSRDSTCAAGIQQGEGEGEARVCASDIIVIVETDGRADRQFRPGFR